MRNKKGYTLMELVIVIALLSAIAILFYSLFGQGFKLYAAQSESAAEMTNLRTVLSDITNKARLTNPASISYSSGILQVGSDSYSYSLTDQAVKKNGTILAKGINSFNVNISGGILGITLVNLDGKSISTSISLG